MAGNTQLMKDAAALIEAQAAAIERLTKRVLELEGKPVTNDTVQGAISKALNPAAAAAARVTKNAGSSIPPLGAHLADSPTVEKVRKSSDERTHESWDMSTRIRKRRAEILRERERS